MMPQSRKFLLLHGIILCTLGSVALLKSITGLKFSLGAFAFLSQNEVAAVGFIEAYGLAAMLGLALIVAAKFYYGHFWHFYGALIHIFLFCINLLFWHLYAPLGLVVVGRIATSMHFVLSAIELYYFATRSVDSNKKHNLKK